MPVVPLATLSATVVALYVADNIVEAFKRYNFLYGTTPKDRTTARDFLWKYLDLLLQKAVVKHGHNPDFARCACHLPPAPVIANSSLPCART
jgi:hypothetical protein